MDDDGTARRPHLRLVDGTRGPDVVEPGRHRSPEEPGYPMLYEADTELEPPRPPALPPRFVVLGLLAIQALGALSYLDKYVELTRSMAISPAAALLSVPAALALYAGALMLMLRPGRGRALFIVASVGFGFAVPFWGISYGWTWPIAAGSMLGLAGAWVARPAAHQAPPQP
jgi:hypothetical protein